MLFIREYALFVRLKAILLIIFLLHYHCEINWFRDSFGLRIIFKYGICIVFFLGLLLLQKLHFWLICKYSADTEIVHNEKKHSWDRKLLQGRNVICLQKVKIPWFGPSSEFLQIPATYSININDQNIFQRWDKGENIWRQKSVSFP